MNSQFSDCEISCCVCWLAWSGLAWAGLAWSGLRSDGWLAGWYGRQRSPTAYDAFPQYTMPVVGETSRATNVSSRQRFDSDFAWKWFELNGARNALRNGVAPSKCIAVRRYTVIIGILMKT